MASSGSSFVPRVTARIPTLLPDVLGDVPLPVLCGQLIVGGFPGSTMSASFRRALADGERGGVILFKENVAGGPAAVAALNAAIHDEAPPELPPLIGVDQEGGRVARLGPPLLVVPPMRTLAQRGDTLLLEEVAHAQAEELAALGFTTSFAPVLDVDSRPENPVIGDRAFGRDPAHACRQALAYARGLQRGGLLACGKHYPGHGDTTKDSHVELPVVTRDRRGLDAIELFPFRAAAGVGFDALMTAHVVYPALDDARPATLSKAVCTGLLRNDLGFRGVLFSDDLEMKALAGHHSIEESSTLALAAGCDLLLICHDEEWQARALEALVREAERSPAFRHRCEEAYGRALAMRRRVPPRPVRGGDPLANASARAREIAKRLPPGR